MKGSCGPIKSDVKVFSLHSINSNLNPTSSDLSMHDSTSDSSMDEENQDQILTDSDVDGDGQDPRISELLGDTEFRLAHNSGSKLSPINPLPVAVPAYYLHEPVVVSMLELLGKIKDYEQFKPTENSIKWFLGKNNYHNTNKYIYDYNSYINANTNSIQLNNEWSSKFDSFLPPGTTVSEKVILEYLQKYRTQNYESYVSALVSDILHLYFYK